MVDDYRLTRQAQQQWAEGRFGQDEDYRPVTFKQWLQSFEWEHEPDPTEPCRSGRPRSGDVAGDSTEMRLPRPRPAGDDQHLTDAQEPAHIRAARSGPGGEVRDPLDQARRAVAAALHDHHHDRDLERDGGESDGWADASRWPGWDEDLDSGRGCDEAQVWT